MSQFGDSQRLETPAMLILSLAVTLVLFLVAHYAILCRPQQPLTAAFVLCGLSATVGPLFIGLFLPPVALQFIMLCLALGLWPALRRRLRSFLPLSATATVVAYAIPGLLVWQTHREFTSLRERFPFESLEGRVPVPQPASLTEATDRRLTDLEGAIEEGDFFDPRPLRVAHLRQLHEETLSLFVNSPGFGVARMFRPTEWSLTWGLREGPSPDQPGSPALEYGPALPKVLSPEEESDLHRLHEGSVVNFANPNGFGYFRSRRKVAGFQPHQFSRVPEPAKQWQVQAVELVGLLRHKEPVAYVSVRLPSMEELRGAPTRPLDSFEASGLAALHRGEDLYVGGTGDGVRLLGAVRSARQCVECHGGQRGDLLGAFSYSLSRSSSGGNR
jgi:hypothetical protein